MKKNKVTYIPMYQISRMMIGIIAANSRYIDIMLVVTVSLQYFLVANPFFDQT